MDMNHTDSNDLTHNLTRGQSVGLTVVAEGGLVSLVAVLYVFLLIFRNVAWRIRNISRDRWQVFHTPMDLLMFSLFLADLLLGVGGVMNLKWINEGTVQVGKFCTAQGFLKQLGKIGVAITTLLITLYTFLGIWLGKTATSTRVTKGVLFAVWFFSILSFIIGNTVHRGPGKTPFFSPTPYWCSISGHYLQWRIWGEYFWLWITLALSVVAYVPLWLWSRGNIVINDQSLWKFKLQYADVNVDSALKGLRRRSLMMLAYPFAYCILILPLSIVRWITFFPGKNGTPASVPSAATLAVDTLFNLSGAVNVVLLLTTRPESALFGKQTHFSPGRASFSQQSMDNSEVDCFNQGAPSGDEAELGALPSRL